MPDRHLIWTESGRPASGGQSVSAAYWMALSITDLCMMQQADGPADADRKDIKASAAEDFSYTNTAML